MYHIHFTYNTKSIEVCDIVCMLKEFEFSHPSRSRYAKLYFEIYSVIAMTLEVFEDGLMWDG